MLRTWLTVLSLACSLSVASEGSFSVNDDLFAYPQYEVVFEDDYITLDEAVVLLDQKESEKVAKQSHSDVSLPSDSDDTDQPKHEGADYETVTLHDQPYFCTIPHVTRSTNNETEHKSSEEDVQKELARAADKGRELLAGMKSNQCLYYSTSWWTYSFCYNQEVRQFHALSLGQTGGRTWPPQQDPTTPAFVLGKVDAGTKDPSTPDESSQHTVSTEIQTKAETSYLVQRLEGGTQCDLTGEDRKIDIEFHCNPQLTDRIGWIKETSTCAYLMVVYTPRLCSDVAFLPPKESRAHPITCREILNDQQAQAWEAEKQQQAKEYAQLLDQGVKEQPIMVGDIQVGGMKYFKDGKKLERGRIVLTQDERAETIAMQKDGKVTGISKADLKKLELDPADIEKFKQELEKLAGSKDWKIERLDDVNGQIQLRGVVSEDEKPGQAAKKEKTGKKPVVDGDSEEREEATPEVVTTEDDEGSEEDDMVKVE